MCCHECIQQRATTSPLLISASFLLSLGCPCIPLHVRSMYLCIPLPAVYAPLLSPCSVHAIHVYTYMYTPAFPCWQCMLYVYVCTLAFPCSVWAIHVHVICNLAFPCRQYMLYIHYILTCTCGVSCSLGGYRLLSNLKFLQASENSIYRIVGKFGEGFDLAIWQICGEIAKLKPCQLS